MTDYDHLQFPFLHPFDYIHFSFSVGDNLPGGLSKKMRPDDQVSFVESLADQYPKTMALLQLEVRGCLIKC